MSGDRRPGFSDIDAFGLSHPGKVREQNQDHFFVGALARGVVVDSTNVTEDGHPLVHAERLASLAIVADGVGGRPGGADASRMVVRDLVSAVSTAFHDAESLEPDDPQVFSRLLHDAALACHQSLVSLAEREGRRPATTVTLFLGLWPHAYLLQVGDSRCYVFKDGRLNQISRDQTWAQDMVDSGALTQTHAEKSKWAGVLSSAVGGEDATPEVTRVVRDWGTVVLLCSDGLTKHVSDELIEERIATMTSSRQVAEQLLQDALDGGGSDNIAIVVGRTLRPDEPRGE